MSLPNCRRRVSECMCCSAAPPPVSVLFSLIGDPPVLSLSASTLALREDLRLGVDDASLKLALARLVTGDSGISCASG